MAKVLGLGGVFLKVKDRDAWRDWYGRVLGVDIGKWGGTAFPNPPEGQTVLSSFAIDTDHFAPSIAPFMINLVVDDMDGILARAKAAGVEPLGRQDDTYGVFAWLMDPAGVKVELWQPAPEDPADQAQSPATA